MWRNRHICTKFQENRHIFGSTKKNFFETWHRHIEPGMWRNVTEMWRHIISWPSLIQTQVQVLKKNPAWNDPQQSLDRISRSKSNQQLVWCLKQTQTRKFELWVCGLTRDSETSTSFQHLACRDRAICGSLFRIFCSKLSRSTDWHTPETHELAGKVLKIYVGSKFMLQSPPL